MKEDRLSALSNINIVDIAKKIDFEEIIDIVARMPMAAQQHGCFGVRQCPQIRHVICYLSRYYSTLTHTNGILMFDNILTLTSLIAFVWLKVDTSTLVTNFQSFSDDETPDQHKPYFVLQKCAKTHLQQCNI